MSLPQESIGRLGLELAETEVASVLQGNLVNEVTPLRVEELSVEMVEKAGVSQESCR